MPKTPRLHNVLPLQWLMRSVVAIVLAAGVGGCSTIDTRSYSGLSADKAAETRVGEIIRILEKCPVTEGESQIFQTPLFSDVKLVASVVTSAIGEAIKEAKEGLSGQFLAYGAYNAVEEVSNAEKSENSSKCVTLVTLARGLIGPLGKNLPKQDGNLQFSDLKTLGLADYPAFYLELEAKREPINDGKGATSKHKLTLTPVYLHYAQSSARLEGSGSKTVSVVIAIGEKQPKSLEKIDTDAVAVYRHNFGRLEIGKHYGKKQLADTAATQTVSSFPGPMIYALVTESENPSIALRALETAFQSNKSGLFKALE